MSKIVVALGGNTILQARKKFTIKQEEERIAYTCRKLVDIIKMGHEIVITHGNGPQVGDLLLAQECAKQHVPQLTLDILDAQTQGELGYLIQRILRNELQKSKIKKQVAAVITQVVVDKNDSAFRNKTKFIGPFFRKKIPKTKKDSNRGYRMVAASPDPKDIVEKKEIKGLIDNGYIVIACGGGGIPVFRIKQRIEGAEAVIDKDLSSELLASQIGADTLLILTDTDYVYLNYGTDKEIPLKNMTIHEAERYMKLGQFLPGSMGPKIEAAVRFIKHGGSRTIITSPEYAAESLKGMTGTMIS